MHAIGDISQLILKSVIYNFKFEHNFSFGKTISSFLKAVARDHIINKEAFHNTVSTKLTVAMIKPVQGTRNFHLRYILLFYFLWRPCQSRHSKLHFLID